MRIIQILMLIVAAIVVGGCDQGIGSAQKEEIKRPAPPGPGAAAPTD